MAPRATLLSDVDSALRTDYAFLHDLEAAIQRFKSEEQTLASTTTLASTAPSTPPPALFPAPRTHLAFPFYASDSSSSFAAPTALTINSTLEHRGDFRDYADFLHVLAHHGAAAPGARWIMSMVAPCRGVWTSPAWCYCTPQMRAFHAMVDQDGYERFLEAERAAGGALLVRVGGEGRVHVQFTRAGKKAVGRKRRGWIGRRASALGALL